MNKLLYGVWCEWDIGQERLLFPTFEAAKSWFENNPLVIEMAKQEVEENPQYKATVEEEIENLWFDCAGTEIYKIIE